MTIQWVVIIFCVISHCAFFMGKLNGDNQSQNIWSNIVGLHNASLLNVRASSCRIFPVNTNVSARLSLRLLILMASSACKWNSSSSASSSPSMEILCALHPAKSYKCLIVLKLINLWFCSFFFGKNTTKTFSTADVNSYGLVGIGRYSNVSYCKKRRWQTGSKRPSILNSAVTIS